MVESFRLSFDEYILNQHTFKIILTKCSKTTDIAC